MPLKILNMKTAVVCQSLIQFFKNIVYTDIWILKLFVPEKPAVYGQETPAVSHLQNTLLAESVPKALAYHNSVVLD